MSMQAMLESCTVYFSALNVQCPFCKYTMHTVAYMKVLLEQRGWWEVFSSSMGMCAKL